MSIRRAIITALLLYPILVLAAEFTIWRMQPVMDDGLKLSIPLPGGQQMERNLASFEFEGELYVASNHWFRSWYHAALQAPELLLIRGKQPERRRAVRVSAAQHKRLSADYSMGFALRLICGFAPSKFLRLETINSNYSTAITYWR